MADVYNIAIKHLQGKYGKQSGFTAAFYNELAKLNTRKQVKERKANITDKDYETVIIPDLIDKTSNDWVIWLLVNQYRYGIKIKQELETNLLINGIIRED
jgi:hypothetical protein